MAGVQELYVLEEEQISKTYLMAYHKQITRVRQSDIEKVTTSGHAMECGNQGNVLGMARNVGGTARDRC